LDDINDKSRSFYWWHSIVSKQIWRYASCFLAVHNRRLYRQKITIHSHLSTELIVKPVVQRMVLKF